MINDHWAPSSKIDIPFHSNIWCADNGYMAVFSNGAACRRGEFETDIVGVNKSVVVIVCPVPLLSSFVFV